MSHESPDKSGTLSERQIANFMRRVIDGATMRGSLVKIELSCADWLVVIGALNACANTAVAHSADHELDVLKRAINESGDCLPECDSIAHEPNCPNVNASARMIEMQSEIDRLRACASSAERRTVSLLAIDAAARALWRVGNARIGHREYTDALRQTYEAEALAALTAASFTSHGERKE